MIHIIPIYIIANFLINIKRWTKDQHVGLLVSLIQYISLPKADIYCFLTSNIIWNLLLFRSGFGDSPDPGMIASLIILWITEYYVVLWLYTALSLIDQYKGI